MSQVFRRGQIKASITKFQTFLDEFTDSPLNQAKLQQRIENLKTVFKALPDITAQLMANNPDGDHATIETELTEVYMDVLAAATLLQHNYTETSNTRSVTPAISVASSNQNLDHNLSRMPKRELRKFDGKIEEWKSFSHWFKSNVHDRVGISDSTRMSYLQDTLVGEAASTIAGLEATNENYKEAWDLLETTYNNEEAIISRHFELLVAIPKIQNNSGESIRQLVNETLVHVRGMKVLGEPTDQWNTPLLYHTISKLDNTTKQEWYRRKVDKTKRSFDDLIDFLREEAMKIQTNTQKNNSNPTIKQTHMKNNYGSKLNQQKSKQVLTTVLFKNCPICEEDGHPTYKCKKLLKLTVPQRINTARKANLCLNCLRNNHHTNQCHRGNCFKCGKVHHTILHLEKGNNNDEEKDDGLVVTSSSKTNSVVLLNRGKVEEIMVTALINILDKNNQPIRCRTLLDTAATSNLITESLAESLGLRKQKYSLVIGGLGDIQTSSSFKVKATIQSRFNNFERSLELYTVPEITKQHPNNYIDKRKLKLSDKINLADPTFNVPGNIDLLIGAGSALASFISGHKDMSIPEGPDLFLQNTQFGWVIGGAISLNNKSRNIKTKQNDITCHITTIQALQQLTQTWAIEDGPKIKHLSEEERACEEHYKSHTMRNKDGSYVVALPFNSKQSLLGETRTRALNRFKSLENKFKRNPELAKQYKNIIQEYLDLGHMEPSYNSADEEGFYLPHHAIMKESSNTTKIRIVFDGSSKSSTGLSLNDALLTGATIQKPLFNHLIRFRMHQIILVGDIEKMFRYVWVRPQDRKYLKLIWRDESGTIKDYQLTINSFGTTSATFLAVRTLEQLAEDEKQDFPEAAKILKEEFYVDDLITGMNSIPKAIKIRNDLTQLLQKGGFNIRQWASNEPQVLEGLAEEEINKNLHIETDPKLKTLGLYWQTQSDLLIYELNKLPVNATMRIILAEIAKIFDPLGLLGPLILAARLILQECWRQEVTWDQELPNDIQIAWRTFTTEFNNTSSIKYNRSLVSANTCDLQLHGFSDASEKAYGACIYLRWITTSGEVQVNLLCARSKVAPLQIQTLARLELCAALMLAYLYESIRELLPVQLSNITFWSDSTITLSWIKTPPYQLKTFVANRVSQIQAKTPITSWRHIRSEDNPADACSRGQTPDEFVKNVLWRSGPHWLRYAEDQWPDSIISVHTEDNERKQLTCLTTCVKSKALDDSFIKYFSTATTLHRATARLLRLKNNSKYTGELTPEELWQSQIKIIRLIQSINFAKDIHNLKHKQNIHESSKLKLLSPFFDKDGILRVGGRLNHANISFDQKHPIILPQSHPYTTLIIEEAHRKHFHAGTQTTLYAVRRQFWPLNSRNEVKRVTHHCIRCIKAKPKTATYPMGELPRERVTQTRPFYHTGVDYCGPFYIKEKKYRNRGKIKVYVAVFVCLAVKATHFEVVSDLTTDGFIAALRRFISRRGKCHTMHSDNGTNFIGANNQLREIYQQINSEEHQSKVQRYLADEGIKWKFIPARSPNFGGLWEAAVKSFKNHLVRIVGDTLITFEELNTLVIEIEAILNSRPLTASSSDPNDPIAITPGHFLIGDSLTSIPDWDWSDKPSNRLSSWQLIQKLKQAFWKRWHKEYLNGLNIRNKWQKGSHQIKEGTIVIIKEDNTRPLHWPIGQVIQSHPGSDGIIRTVSIRTSHGVIDRSVRRLAILLPNDRPNESN